MEGIAWSSPYQRRQSRFKFGGRGSVSKQFRYFHANFRKILIFSGNFKKNFDFPGENVAWFLFSAHACCAGLAVAYMLLTSRRTCTSTAYISAIAAVRAWMSPNRLQLDPNKTRYIWLSNSLVKLDLTDNGLIATPRSRIVTEKVV